MNYNDNYMDFINLVSLMISLMNLSENREQPAHNDIQGENQRQAEFLLREINRQFEEQNKLLRRILDVIEPPTTYNNAEERRDANKYIPK